MKSEQKKDIGEILNKNKVNPFKSNNELELKGRLNIMTFQDMKSLALKVGVINSGDKSSLKKELLKAFRRFKVETVATSEGNFGREQSYGEETLLQIQKILKNGKR